MSSHAIVKTGGGVICAQDALSRSAISNVQPLCRWTAPFAIVMTTVGT